MIIKPKANGTSGWWLGGAILIVGFLLGALLEPLEWFQRWEAARAREDQVQPGELAAFLVPAEVAAQVPENGLETLHVSFDSQAAGRLQRVRDDAMDLGMILQSAADTVPGEVRMGPSPMAAELRIKGDWTDHVDTDKWSLRIKLKRDKLKGMSSFSVQHPRTRGMLWEWLVLAAARREGLLAPRAQFVNVSLNGNPMGVYYLEEHFSKELLESQERREGPIVLWDESARWASLLQVHNVLTKDVKLPVPKGRVRTQNINAAEVRGYGLKRLNSIESLSRSMQSAVEQMQALQSLAIARMGIESPLRRLRALEDVRGKTLERLVDIDKLAQMHALMGLFQIWHALVWHNMRFYHDPLHDRLEPILFDCNAHKPSARDLPMFRANDALMAEFGSSHAYYEGVIEHAARFAAPGYLEGLMAEVGSELRIYERALEAEFGLESSYTVEGMLERLRGEQAFLRTVLDPVDAINVHATQSANPGASPGEASLSLEVECWITTRTPVEVRGFEFGNGTQLPAAGLLLEDSEGLRSTPEGGVILPKDGTPLRFRFPSDARLSGLRKVEEALAAALDPSASQGSSSVEVQLLYRPLGVSGLKREPLSFRRSDPSWRAAAGRPAPPSLQEALERHAFLQYRHELQQLWVQPGKWQVQGDLLLPEGHALHAADAKLFFDVDAALISSGALHFERVSLAPKVGLERWSGVVVLQAEQRSHWKRVTVRATDALARGGWVVTGGISFYRSSVDMLDCHIDGTWAEDGTNVFSADFNLERVQFTGCVSDSFDGDFVTGTLKNCLFQDGLADGVDVSGSQVLVQDCRFLDMGDKAISAGEDSRVEVQGGLCRNVSIGIAAKDRSEVSARGLRIEGARHYALAVFIKKPEFGAATMSVQDLVLQGSGLGDALVQSGCALEIDGLLQPTEDLDVKQLYRDKILGQ